MDFLNDPNTLNNTKARIKILYAASEQSVDFNHLIGFSEEF